jgi:hypothetical protein
MPRTGRDAYFTPRVRCVADFPAFAGLRAVFFLDDFLLALPFTACAGAFAEALTRAGDVARAEVWTVLEWA